MQRNSKPYQDVIDHICLSYDFPVLVWSAASRTGNQLVTALLDKDVADHFHQIILKLDVDTNHDAFKVVKTRNGQDKFRVLVYLEKYDLEAALAQLKQKQLIIINFLNEVHRPRWQSTPFALSDVKWCLDNNEICFIGPSCKYSPDDEVGVPVSHALINDFDDHAISQGFTPNFIQKFQQNLKIEDHKYGRVHCFSNNHFIQGELFLMAELYCPTLVRESRAFVVNTTVAAFAGSPLPAEVCKIIGFFAQPADGRRLACVNTKSALAATETISDYCESAKTALADLKR